MFLRHLSSVPFVTLDWYVARSEKPTPMYATPQYEEKTPIWRRSKYWAPPHSYDIWPIKEQFSILSRNSPCAKSYSTRCGLSRIAVTIFPKPSDLCSPLTSIRNLKRDAAKLSLTMWKTPMLFVSVNKTLINITKTTHPPSIWPHHL